MESFQKLIHGDKPVLVDFHATWCVPCKQMAPELTKFAREHTEKLRVVKIDVDKNPQVASKYQIRGVPTLIVFKNGQIKWRQSGVFPANELERILKENS